MFIFFAASIIKHCMIYKNTFVLKRAIWLILFQLTMQQHIDYAELKRVYFILHAAPQYSHVTSNWSFTCQQIYLIWISCMRLFFMEFKLYYNLSALILQSISSLAIHYCLPFFTINASSWGNSQTKMSLIVLFPWPRCISPFLLLEHMSRHKTSAGPFSWKSSEVTPMYNEFLFWKSMDLSLFVSWFILRRVIIYLVFSQKHY